MQIFLLIAAIIATWYVNKSIRWYWFLVMGFGFYFLFFGTNHDPEGYVNFYGLVMVIGGFVMLGVYKLMVSFYC